MIRKKSIFYFVLITFLFSQSDLLAMNSTMMHGIKNKPAGFTPYTSAGGTSLVQAASILMPDVLKMDSSMKLSGKDETMSVQDQWSRFIKHYPNEINSERIEHSLSALYQSFIKEIDEYGNNNKKFKELIKNKNISSVTINSSMFRLKDFLNIDVVKKMLLNLGMQSINVKKNNLKVKTSNELEMTDSEFFNSLEEAREELLQPNVDPLAEKTIEASVRILNLQNENEEEISRREIEQAYEQELAKLMNQRSMNPMAAEKQQENVEALKVAKEVLEKNLEVDATLESGPVERSAVKSDPITPKFREIVKDEAARIVKDLITKGESLQDLQKQLLDDGRYSSEEMAYALGYFEFHMKSLQVNAGNAVQQLVNIAESLKVLNKQVARNA